MASVGEDVPMTAAHKSKLRVAQTRLIENMDPDPVMRKLYSLKVLTPEDQTKIRENGRATKEQRVANLMEKLAGKKDSAFDKLIHALNDSEQEHVAGEILNYEVDVTDGPAAEANEAEIGEVMTDDHLEQLRLAAEKVIENMNADQVLNSLYSRGVFTLQEVNAMKQNGRATRYDKAQSIMDEIITKNDTAFNILIDALRESEQNHLAKLIINKGVDETESLLNAIPDVPTDADSSSSKNKSREAVKELAR